MKLLIHIDVDSPLKLIDFYKLYGIDFNESQLINFYKIAFERALNFFNDFSIKGTFFLVGNELEKSSEIKNIIKNAFEEKHEIENHTYSHPFGLTSLSEIEIKNEILKCDEIIKSITAVKPIGFRAPGYSMNSQTINMLEELNYKYDSSGFWSIMNYFAKLKNKNINKNSWGNITSKLPHNPYFPNTIDWLDSKEKRKIIELPLPRTKILGLPFYNNFNLWAPNIYSNYFSKTINRDCLVYLFHLIEFVDLNDDIPKELSIHPNLNTPIENKIKNSKLILNNLLKRYDCVRTKDYLDC